MPSISSNDASGAETHDTRWRAGDRWESAKRRSLVPCCHAVSEEWNAALSVTPDAYAMRDRRGRQITS